MVIVIADDLHGRAFESERTVSGFQDSHDLLALPAPGYRTDLPGDALQKVPALVLERLTDFNPRTQNVSVANVEGILAEVVRLGIHRADPLLEDAHLFCPVQVVEDDSPVAADDNDFPRLVGIGPT